MKLQTICFYVHWYDYRCPFFNSSFILSFRVVFCSPQGPHFASKHMNYLLSIDEKEYMYMLSCPHPTTSNSQLTYNNTKYIYQLNFITAKDEAFLFLFKLIPSSILGFLHLASLKFIFLIIHTLFYLFLSLAYLLSWVYNML